MPRKISAISLCTALFAIMVLITPAASVVAADCSPPSSFTVNGTTITLEDVIPEVYEGKQFYRYNYRVDGKKAPNQFNIAIPVCCGDEITIKDVNPNHVYDPGEGEPTNDWLFGYYQAFVARITPHPTPYYSFLASTRTIGETSVCLKVKNKLKCGAIQGPACYQPALSGEELIVTFGNDTWKFIAIDESQCIYEVYKLIGSTYELIEEGDPIASITLNEEEASIVTAPGECIVWAQFGENSTRCPIIRGKKYCR